MPTKGTMECSTAVKEKWSGHQQRNNEKNQRERAQDDEEDIHHEDGPLPT